MTKRLVASMVRAVPRRAVSLLAAVSLVATLGAAPALGGSGERKIAPAGRPTCGGMVATIVSRKGVIRGTRKNDVIVAKGARNNRIYGRGGHDRICAGKGNDIVYGGPGRDRIYGAAGSDRLYGGPANDVLLGGPGNDLCAQGTGTGPRRGCERPLLQAPAPAPTPPPPAPIPEPTPEPTPTPSADLKATVTGPDEFEFFGAPTYVVTVTNLGPDASAYLLNYALYKELTTEVAGCGTFIDASGSHPSLAAGDSRDHTFEMETGCYVPGESIEFQGRVEPGGSTHDPQDRNNVGRKVTSVCGATC